MKSSALYAAIALLGVGLVVSLALRPSSSHSSTPAPTTTLAPAQSQSQSATPAASPNTLQPPPQKAARKLGRVPEEILAAISDANRRVNTTTAQAAEAVAAFEKASKELKAAREAHAALAAVLKRAAAALGGTGGAGLDPACLSNVLPEAQRSACHKAGKLWAIGEGGEVEAQ